MRCTFLAIALATGLTTTSCEPPVDCPTAVRLAFTGTPVAERMVRIAWRESRWNPAARNRHSTATGCLQLLRRHEPRARRLGYQWADMASAWPNARVARSLYDEAGLSPWAQTA